MSNLAISPAERAALRATGLITEPVNNRGSKTSRILRRIKKEIAWHEHARHCLPASANKTKLDTAIYTLIRVKEWLEDPEL